LIAWNHTPAAIWQMTPAQVWAWVTLGLDRERIERALRLIDTATAARRDDSEIQRAISELTGA
jgi:hypothetical protein